MIPRSHYLVGNASHADYYRQFVTPAIRQVFVRCFGREQLHIALLMDPYLNSIPLADWDDLTWQIKLPSLVSELCACGDSLSVATGVCILKEAAKMEMSK